MPKFSGQKQKSIGIFFKKVAQSVLPLLPMYVFTCVFLNSDPVHRLDI
jgi:hypothetical protein